MNHPQVAADHLTDRLDGIIADYLEDVRRGTPPSTDQWLAAHPELAAELASFLTDKSRFDDLAAAVTATPPRPRVASPAPFPQQIGNYEILGELGRGGMGVVYKARQAGLNRIVALKMVLDGSHQKGETLARFQAEAEAVARLEHPNVVQIHEVGQADGLPYFSLEFIDGGNLSLKIAGQPQPTRQSAAIVETLARAMDHAHQQGIVHRDLKPANVLMTAQGMPKITDFGLAKQVEGSDGPTRTGAILGTPCYLAPEQAAAKKTVGPAADVYALGVILYEMLTGRPPFRGDTPMETLLQVMADEPPSPARLNPTVPRDLETICLKCLEKDPAKRYASAARLAEDLRCFRAGESIQARPAGVAERAWRWCRRRPAVASLLALTLILFVGGFAGIVDQWLRARANAVEANRQRRDAQDERDRSNELRQQADGLRQDAQRERDRAEAGFAQAREIVDDLSLRLDRDPGWRQPPVQKLRQEYQQVILNYYKDFAEKHRGDPKLAMALANAHHRIGLATLEVGAVADAEKSLQVGLTLQKEVLARNRKEPVARSKLAVIWIALARAQTQLRRYDEAFRAYKEAENLLVPLGRELPADKRIQDDLVYVYDGTGHLYVQTNQPGRALRTYGDGKAYLAALVRSHSDARRTENLAIFCDNRGRVLFSLNRFAEAKQEYEEAGRLLDATFRQAGRVDYSLLIQLVKHCSDFAVLEMAERNYQDAFTTLSLARAELSKAMTYFPDRSEPQECLSAVCYNMGLALLKLNRPVEAMHLVHESGNLWEKLVKSYPDRVSYRVKLAATWGLAGEIYQSIGQHVNARTARGAARKIYSELLRAHPSDQGFIKAIAELDAQERQAKERQAKDKP